MQYKENIRQDLIKKELTLDNDKFEYYTQNNLTVDFIKGLFDKYDCVEYLEKYYDSTPYYYDDTDESEELWNKEACYSAIFNGGELPEKILNKYKYSLEEIIKAHKEIEEKQEQYEATGKRLEFNNWVDVYAEGVWGWSQAEVNFWAKKLLINIHNHNTTYDEMFGSIQNYHNRLYISKSKEIEYFIAGAKPQTGKIIHIYFYGRDLWGVDYWFTFRLK